MGSARFFLSPPSEKRATPGNALIKTKSRGLPKLSGVLPRMKLLPLTDGLCVEEVGRAAFAFTLAVHSRHLHLVLGLWLQALDGHLSDWTCENTWQAVTFPPRSLLSYPSAPPAGENSRCSINCGIINLLAMECWLAWSLFVFEMFKQQISVFGDNYENKGHNF